MLRRLLTRKTFILTGITLVLLVVIFYTEENWRGRRAWENYRAAAEKRGVKLFLKDFIPADIPDSENYAAVPVYRDLFVKGTDFRAAPDPFGLPRLSDEKNPALPDDIKGRRFDADGWQEFFVKTKLIPEKTDSAAGDILRALGKYEPALQQLRDASSRPKCKFQTRWEDGVAVHFSHLSPALGAVRLFTMNAQAHLGLGDRSAALAEVEQAFRIHTALSSEPSLIAGFVRISILAVIERVVWDGLAGGKWRDEDLSAIEKHFSRLRIGDDCRFTFASERGWMNTMMLTLVEMSASELDRMTGGDIGRFDADSNGKWIAIRAVPRGWMYRVIVRSNDYAEWSLSRCTGFGEDATDAVFPPDQDSKSWIAAHPPSFGVGALESMLMIGSRGGYDTAYKKFLYAQTRVTQTRLACALERFRHAKGAFPEKIEQLVPEFFPTLPKDPFDGEPMRYRRNADGGYDLWSTGPDRKDDGGKIDPSQSGDSQADWIWHMPGGMSGKRP